MSAPAPARRPIRVLHVITGLERGGSETALLRLVTAQDPAMFESRVVALTGGGPVQRALSAAGVQTDSLSHASRLPSVRTYLKLRRIAQDFNPDIVQGWLPHGNLAAVSVARSWRRRPKLVWNVRQALYDLGYEPLGTRFTIRLCAHLSRLTDRIIYNSSIGARHHQDLGYDPAKSLLIYNGFDTTRFRPDPLAWSEIRKEIGVGHKEALIGMVARFHPHKDHPTFFRAAKLLLECGVNAQFVLAGGNVNRSNKALLELIAEHGLSSSTHLLDDREDINRVFAALDIAALSSYTEAFPNVLGEAMACGAVCVTTDVGEARTIVGDCGWVVPTRSPEAMAAAFREVLSSGPEARRAFGDRARQRIESEWTEAATVRKYSELYSGLTNI